MPAGLSPEATDAHNDRLARRMQADGRVFIAPADVDGRTCLRACFVNFRTTRADIEALPPLVERLGRAADAELRPGDLRTA